MVARGSHGYYRYRLFGVSVVVVLAVVNCVNTTLLTQHARADSDGTPERLERLTSSDGRYHAPKLGGLRMFATLWLGY